MKSLSGLSPWDLSGTRINVELFVQNVPESEGWGIGLLTNLLKMTEDKNMLVEDAVPWWTNYKASLFVDLDTKHQHYFSRFI